MSRKSRRTTRNIAILRARAVQSDRLETLITGLGSRDLDTASLAALKLGRLGDLKCIELLEQAIVSGDPRVEWCARAALDQVEARLASDMPASTPAELESLSQKLRSPHLKERSEAVRDLRLRDPGPLLPRLMKCLQQESDPMVLGALIRLILSQRVDAHRETFVPFLTHKELVIRSSTIEGFWGWDDARLVQSILTMYKDSPPKVRGPLFVMIIRRGGPPAQTLVARLITASTMWMNLCAIYAMGGLDEAWARQILVDHIRNPNQPEVVRGLAREAIALSRDPEAPREAGAEGDVTLWTDLTRHLGDLADEAAVMRGLEDKDPLERVHALQNARRFPGPNLLGCLRRLLKWEADPLVLATMVKALARVGGPAQGPEIRKFLSHENSRVRSNALEALTQLKLGPELDTICKNILLEDEVPRIHKQAAAHLFDTNPEDALRHFRGMIMGEDPDIRANALQIMMSFQDDRMIAVLREALKDPSPAVYGQAYGVLCSVAPEWGEAKHLLELYHRGEVVGEVIEGEPVSALLYLMNSPRPAERIHAIGKLLHADDPRVNVVLELNLTARDPNVANEAARALKERHRLFTLPGLHLQLGTLYNDRAVAGMRLVPHSLAERLSRVGAESNLRGTDDWLRWAGQTLFDAFEEDIELDAEIRSVCLEIRTAMEQMGSIAALPESGGREATAGTMTGVSAETQALTRFEFPELTLGTDMRTAAGPAAAPASNKLRLGIAIGALSFAGLAVISSPDQAARTKTVFTRDDGPPTVERSIRLLSAMCLEKDPERFAERFGGHKVLFSGKLLQVIDRSNALVQSGTTLFRVKTPSSTNLGTLRPGQICEVTASIVARQADGSAQLEGTVRLANEV